MALAYSYLRDLSGIAICRRERDVENVQESNQTSRTEETWSGSTGNSQIGKSPDDISEKYNVNEENWESLPTKFEMDYHILSDSPTKTEVLARRQGKVGKFLISQDDVQADSETKSLYSEELVQHTSIYLDLYFNES
jgi:hypothetical protein